MQTSEPLVDVKNLSVDFASADTVSHAVKNISFDIKKGEIVALVGESGSGKSVTALSTMRLLSSAASHPSGEIRFQGSNLLAKPEKEMCNVRGRDIGMIFQEPLTSLNPLHTVGRQVSEVLKLHQGMTNGEARARTIELFTKVGIPDPEERIHSYPHQLSGGQRQRIMIALALANNPDLLIADEPTTALDVTIQAQILALLKQLQSEMHMAVLLITHDLGIVRKMADRVCVMRQGEIVERGTVDDIFNAPQHPYTQHLLASEPKGTPPETNDTGRVILETDDLRVWYPIKRGILRKTVGHVKAVDGLSLKLREGSTLGVV
ncbi:MAG: ATP-binding cassette domain-containing protein, partial [Alphaproteobacteria bacterium]